MSWTTVGSLLRSTQSFAQQICEKETLDYGIAFGCQRFAGLAEASQFREVSLAAPAELACAFEQAERWFEGRGMRCLRWAPAEGQSEEWLEGFLGERGFRARRWDALMLAQWRELPPPPGSFRILHARAMRRAFRETFHVRAINETTVANESADLLVEAYAERLDDPSYDAFVALIDGIPAGRATLYQVGDIARVLDVCAAADDAGSIVRDALLRHALGLARRLAMRTVVAQVSREDELLRAAMDRAGFAKDGEIVEFERA